MEKDSKKFPQTSGWGYAQFDYDPASATFTPDKAATPVCGDMCHVKMKVKDYVFHPTKCGEPITRACNSHDTSPTRPVDSCASGWDGRSWP